MLNKRLLIYCAFQPSSVVSSSAWSPTSPPLESITDPCPGRTLLLGFISGLHSFVCFSIPFGPHSPLLSPCAPGSLANGFVCVLVTCVFSVSSFLLCKWLYAFELTTFLTLEFHSALASEVPSHGCASTGSSAHVMHPSPSDGLQIASNPSSKLPHVVLCEDLGKGVVYIQGKIARS